MSNAAPPLDYELLRSVREHAASVRSINRIVVDVLDSVRETDAAETVSTQLEHAKQLLVAGCQTGGVKPPLARRVRRELQLQ